MIRILGVICGATIATGLLTWLVGVPQFTNERVAAEPRPAVVALPEPAPPSPAPPIDSAAVTAALAEVAERPAGTLPNPLPQEPSGGEHVAPDEEPSGATPAATQWFTFWAPFRSEIAATGFVGRLQSVTGLDYRVVRAKPGVYEVEFAYTDESEIDSNLASISAATGLELAGVR